MDTNDPDLLVAAYYPRTMSYYTDENQLVGVSIGEWEARFNDDLRNKTPIEKAERKIIKIDTFETIGFVKFTHQFEKFQITDYALLLKTKNRWRIINLMFTVV
jgi:hypothetical protein